MPYTKLLLILLMAVLVVTAVSLLTFYSAIRPPKYVSHVTPADLNLKYESVKLVTEDDVELDAWFIPAGKKTDKTVIVLHGYPFDKGNILPHSIFLHDEFNLFLFDFRYLGKSKGSYSSVGFHEQKDLRAATKYLRRRNQTKLGAFGFSLGGAVALMEAKNSNVNAVVTESSYASLENMLKESYGLFGPFKFPFVITTKLFSKLLLGINIAEVSPEKSIKELGIPLLIVHGSVDDQISVENAHQLKKANENVELWIVEGANHGMAGNVAKDYEKRILKFLRENLN